MPAIGFSSPDVCYSAFSLSSAMRFVRKKPCTVPTQLCLVFDLYMCAYVLVDEANVQESRELKLPKLKNALCARRSDLEEKCERRRYKQKAIRIKGRTFIASLDSYFASSTVQT